MWVFPPIPCTVFFFQLYYIFTGKWQSRSDFVILAYAGLRGALGLILALELNKVVSYLSSYPPLTPLLVERIER